MDFSVLMSVYGKDNPAFFDLALRSISVDQSVKPKQVVIVQDGPVPADIDNIIETVEKLCDSIEFTVIRKEKNEGLAAALNDGLKLCKYDWVARMDSDDISAPDRFELQTEYLSANPDISVVGSSTEEFNEIPGDIGQSVRVVKEKHSEIVRMAKIRTPMNHPTVFYNKTSVLSVGGYAVDFGKLEDYKLWVDMISAGYLFANINKPLVFMRIGNGFIDRRSSKREIGDWDMLQSYLLKSNIVNKREAFKNKLYIRAFIYMPGWTKKIAYKTILRK